jgi:hypothetical protein
MNETINFHIDSIDDMGKRFVNAWHRLEQGEDVKETHLNLMFFDLEKMRENEKGNNWDQQTKINKNNGVRVEWR